MSNLSVSTEAMKMWLLSHLQVCIPLFYEAAAGLGSKGGTEKSGQEEVVGTLTLLRSMFLEMKAKQQQQREEKEQALFKEINTYFKSLLCNHYLFHTSLLQWQDVKHCNMTSDNSVCIFASGGIEKWDWEVHFFITQQLKYRTYCLETQQIPTHRVTSHHLKYCFYWKHQKRYRGLLIKGCIKVYLQILQWC